ncbi:molybdopterin-dependent oxidoreductase [Streptomyces sp. NPDC056485]|uniref:molybdopterin-dependent oxidoreductase n=1 Tax=Streptomyces sp. NPDC056485 TaxID=3345834 RepID=UPI00369FFF1F
MPGVSSFRTTLLRTARGASTGLLAGFSALAVAELTAGLVRPAAGPVTVVGGAVIDRTPAGMKDFAIRTFGENDKTVLQVGILLLLALFAVVLGVVSLSYRRAGAAGVLAFGVLGAAAALSRPDSAGAGDALPSAVGALAAAAVLYGLAAKAAPVGSTSGDTGTGSGWSRRGFLTAAGVTAAAATGTGVAGRALSGRRGRGAAASRDSLALPAPSSPAPAVPAGARPGAGGISAFTTPNREFYRVDTARWLGVPLAGLLAECSVRAPSKGGGADQLVARSVDGMTLGSPVEDVLDGRDAMLAVGMNGEPLPFAHGYPVRMLVPGLYGYVSACKWITEIELTTFEAYDPYWVKRKWARRAPVKTQSRIDTPKPFARPAVGTVVIAGVAWAQRRGITRVEVRVDDGPWTDADLAPQHSLDTWRQWSYRWQAAAGGHTLTVRATDGTAAVQTDKRARTIPDGASGWHSVFVTVP